MTGWRQVSSSEHHCCYLTSCTEIQLCQNSRLTLWVRTVRRGSLDRRGAQQAWGAAVRSAMWKLKYTCCPCRSMSAWKPCNAQQHNYMHTQVHVHRLTHMQHVLEQQVPLQRYMQAALCCHAVLHDIMSNLWRLVEHETQHPIWWRSHTHPPCTQMQ